MKLNENARFKSKIEGSELSGKGDSAGRTAKAGDNIDYSEAFSSKYTEATLKKTLRGQDPMEFFVSHPIPMIRSKSVAYFVFLKPHGKMWYNRVPYIDMRVEQTKSVHAKLKIENPYWFDTQKELYMRAKESGRNELSLSKKNRPKTFICFKLVVAPSDLPIAAQIDKMVSVIYKFYTVPSTKDVAEAFVKGLVKESVNLAKGMNYMSRDDSWNVKAETAFIKKVEDAVKDMTKDEPEVMWETPLDHFLMDFDIKEILRELKHDSFSAFDTSEKRRMLYKKEDLPLWDDIVVVSP